MEEQLAGKPQDGQEDSTGMDVALPSADGAHALSPQPANAPGGYHRAREVWHRTKPQALIGQPFLGNLTTEHGIPLLSLPSNACRFPIGTDKDGTYLFCAKPSERHQGKASAYCGCHNLICYARPGASKPKPAKVFDCGDGKQRGAQTAIDTASWWVRGR